MKFLDWLLLRIPADTESGWAVYLAAALVVLWQWRWFLGHLRIPRLLYQVLLWSAVVAFLLPVFSPAGTSSFMMPALTTFVAALLNGDSEFAAQVGRILLLAISAVICLVLGISALHGYRHRRRTT